MTTNLVELNQKSNEANEIQNENLIIFDNKDIAELAGLYADKIFYETGNNIDKIKQSILVWFKNNKQLIEENDNNISETEINKLTDQTKLRAIFVKIIYYYLIQNRNQRSLKEKLIMKEMEDINWLKLSISRLLRQINRKITSQKWREEIKKRLNVRQKIETNPTPHRKNNIVKNKTSIKPKIPQMDMKAVHRWANSGGKNLATNYEYLWENISDKDIDKKTKTIIEKLKRNNQCRWSLTKIENIKNNGFTILKNSWETPFFHEKATPDLISMAVEFYEITWSPLNLVSGYRTHSHQERLLVINKKKKIPTAPAGKSWHNSAIAFDVAKSSRYNSKIWGINWFRALAKKHNFDKIPSEDRHFEHIPMRTAIGRDNRINVSKMLDKNYEKYWA